MELLSSLKEYLVNRPEAAFLALTLVALWYMFRKYEKSQADHLATLSKIAPLAEKLSQVISRRKNKDNIGKTMIGNKEWR